MREGLSGSPRSRALRSKLLLIGVAWWSATPASALTLATNTIEVASADAQLTLVSSVEDNDGGDASRWRFTYLLSGASLVAGGNGLSSLQLFFGDVVEDVANQSAPPGWVVDCCFALAPFGVGFDTPDGTGVTPGASAQFSFTVPAGTGWTSASQGSFAATWVGDAPDGFVVLEDGATGAGPIVPVPEPHSLALVALGVAALARGRRKEPDGSRATRSEPKASEVIR